MAATEGRNDAVFARYMALESVSTPKCVIFALRVLGCCGSPNLCLQKGKIQVCCGSCLRTRRVSHFVMCSQAEYVWIGGKGDDLRSKGRTFDSLPASLEDLPEWNFDGSSTAQAEGHDSEVLLL